MVQALSLKLGYFRQMLLASENANPAISAGATTAFGRYGPGDAAMILTPEVAFVKTGGHREVLAFQSLKRSVLPTLVKRDPVFLASKQRPPTLLFTLAQLEQLLRRLMILDFIRVLGHRRERSQANLLEDHDSHCRDPQHKPHFNALIVRHLGRNTADLLFQA